MNREHTTENINSEPREGMSVNKKYVLAVEVGWDQRHMQILIYIIYFIFLLSTPYLFIFLRYKKGWTEIS